MRPPVAPAHPPEQGDRESLRGARDPAILPAQGGGRLHDKSDRLGFGELRGLLRLALDLRDLPSGSEQQRRAALLGISSLVGAQVALWLDIDGVSTGQGVVRRALDVGWSGEGERRAFLAYIETAQQTPLDPSIPRVARALAGGRRTFTRQELVPDREWYRSDHVQRFRRGAGVDNFIYATHPDAGDRGHTISLHRPWGERPFTERERRLVELFHEECQFLREPVSPVSPSVLRDLSPRLRDTLLGLSRGRSEKQVAADLGISPHTVHEYVKALHRHFGVQSRSELLARCLAGR